MKLRKIAAGAAMLAGLTLATTPTRAPAETAATASPVQIHPAAHRAGKPHRTARAQPDQGKTHRGKRSRLALARHRHRPAPEPVAATPEKPEPTLQEASDAPRDTPSARRFREFLSPQSFAVALSEDLRKPRLLAAHLSGEMADPQIIAATWTGVVEGEPQENAAPNIAHDEAIGDTSHSPTAVLNHSDALEVRRTVRAAVDNEPPRMSFVRWFFIAWGGVLTFASALRMAVG